MIPNCKALIEFAAGLDPVYHRVSVAVRPEILPTDTRFRASHPLSDLEAAHLSLKWGDGVKMDGFDEFHDISFIGKKKKEDAIIQDQ